MKVELTTYDGRFYASVPSGTSTGAKEAVALPAKKAVKNVNEIISQKVIGMDPTAQKDIDTLLCELDGTPDKGRLGANALLGVSVAVAKAGANHMHQEVFDYLLHMTKESDRKRRMPFSYILMAEGGKHSFSSLAIQEFMIVPRINNFAKSFDAGVDIYHTLGKIMKNKKMNTNVGMEGAFSPPLSNTSDVLDLIQNAVDEAGYSGKDIAFAIDAAASSFFKQGKYLIDGKQMSGEDLVDYYHNLVDKYHLVSIEDPFDENDWNSWKLLTQELHDGVRIVGDDLTVSNVSMIEKAFENHACNALLLKPNQIGTVTEALNAWQAANSHKWPVIVSHRSGETNDDFIADLAVALNADCKFGAPCRGERLAKYNRLLKIDSIIRGLNV